MTGASANRSDAYGALVLHGFTGTPASVLPLADAFAGAGYRVMTPLLPGHGVTRPELDASTYAEWRAAALGAFDELALDCDGVVLAGLSMGGALACEVALARPGVAGLVLVNPFVEPPTESFLEILEAALASGTTEIPAIASDIANTSSTEEAAATTPLRPLLSLSRGVRALAPQLFELTAPLLLFTSRTDHVVPPSSSDFLAGAVSGPVERVILERSYHVATLDFDAPELCRRAVEFACKLGWR